MQEKKKKKKAAELITKPTTIHKLFPGVCIMRGLNKSTWTCDIWRVQRAFYSPLIHPPSDNNSHCSTNMARDMRTELEKRHCRFVCVIQLNHALFIMQPSIMKENTETAQTLSVCLDSATLDTGEGDGCVTSLRFCWNENIFLFSSPPLSSSWTHTVGIARWIPLEISTQIIIKKTL